MGVKNRLKQAPKGIGETLEDVSKEGFIGAGLNTLRRFGKRNAEAVKTLGEDVGARR